MSAEIGHPASVDQMIAYMDEKSRPGVGEENKSGLNGK